MIDIPKRAPEKNTLANKLRDQSLTVRGGRVFNKLTVHIRNSIDITLDTFKHRLDEYLQIIPDHPCIPGLYPEPTNKESRKQSNDLGDWIDYLHIGERRPMDNLVSLDI